MRLGCRKDAETRREAGPCPAASRAARPAPWGHRADASDLSHPDALGSADLSGRPATSPRPREWPQLSLPALWGRGLRLSSPTSRPPVSHLPVAALLASPLPRKQAGHSGLRALLPYPPPHLHCVPSLQTSSWSLRASLPQKGLSRRPPPSHSLSLVSLHLPQNAAEHLTRWGTFPCLFVERRLREPRNFVVCVTVSPAVRRLRCAVRTLNICPIGEWVTLTKWPRGSTVGPAGRENWAPPRTLQLTAWGHRPSLGSPGTESYQSNIRVIEDAQTLEDLKRICCHGDRHSLFCLNQTRGTCFKYPPSLPETGGQRGVQRRMDSLRVRGHINVALACGAGSRAHRLLFPFLLPGSSRNTTGLESGGPSRSLPNTHSRMDVSVGDSARMDSGVRLNLCCRGG